MLDALKRIYEEGGPLVGVAYSMYNDNANWVTAVGLRFGTISAVFRAVPDDDTLNVSLGPLTPDEDETVIEVTESNPWCSCVGRGVSWAWRLTNQQGYSDGARLEFCNPDEQSSTVVEFVVVASGIQILTLA